MRRSGSPKFGTWFCRKDLAGGGCMLDIGVHVLDMCLYITDNFEPVSVTGKVNTKFGNRGIGEGGWGKSDRGKMIFDVDDSAFAFIRFKNGMVLELNVSWILHQDVNDKNGVQLYGTEAGGSTNPCRIFRFGKKGGEYEVVEPQNVKIRYPHCNRHANWIDAILGKDELMTPPEQSLVVQKIIDAVYKSSETGKEVRM
jgi:predicted dehydrogenase